MWFTLYSAEHHVSKAHPLRLGNRDISSDQFKTALDLIGRNALDPTAKNRKEAITALKSLQESMEEVLKKLSPGELEAKASGYGGPAEYWKKIKYAEEFFKTFPMTELEQEASAAVEALAAHFPSPDDMKHVDTTSHGAKDRIERAKAYRESLETFLRDRSPIPPTVPFRVTTPSIHPHLATKAHIQVVPDYTLGDTVVTMAEGKK